MTSPAPKEKGLNVLGALSDFLILVLLIGGAGFGGYYWGTTQRLAPVQLVGAGTPGAISSDKGVTPALAEKSDNQKTAGSQSPAEQKTENKGPDKSSSQSATDKTTDSTPAETSKPATSTKPTEKSSTKNGTVKYWIVSTGADYIGYSITVKVNGTPVDSFFGPDKTVNITKLVKKGENTITFDAKQLGKNYNKHKDDKDSKLTLQLVSGPSVQEDFDPSAVITTYTRQATETEDFNDSEHFVKE